MEEVPTQAEVVEGELQKEDVVIEEPASPGVVAKVPMQTKTAKTLIEEEDATPPVQKDQAKTLDGKVCTQFSQIFVNLDSDDEENARDERI